MEKTIKRILAILLVMLFALSMTVLLFQIWDFWNNKRSYTNVRHRIEDIEVGEDDSGPDNSLTGKYDELIAENDDFYGWIRIEGTTIDHPVMYSPDDPDYYLNHSFDKKYSNYGTPFLDGDFVPGESNNYVIYGHNMKDGSMFADLCKYVSEEFWKKHPRIQFDTADGAGTYEVFGAFRFDTDHENYWFNKQVTMDEEQFLTFLGNVKDRALYETSIEANYGDQLLTLCTCDKTLDNGRFFVIAKRIDA